MIKSKREEAYNVIREIARQYGIEFGELVYTFHLGELVKEEVRKVRRFGKRKKKQEER